ncbi:MAG: hypothetical protein CSA65_07115 [Proteobacteria bacterium]|nr:MAG: hypothetical protein CSB49_06540 [Pseudomonadota bacterium]PIE17917.1 MAG: hypothetical protein CSA65_07115 [Pseudomonadota bacterium]
MAELFGKCCMCSKEIKLGDTFYKCTVSTCKSGRMKLYFCSPACWDAHLPTARHRSAGYTEHVAKAGES